MSGSDDLVDEAAAEMRSLRARADVLESSDAEYAAELRERADEIERDGLDTEPVPEDVLGADGLAKHRDLVARADALEALDAEYADELRGRAQAVVDEAAEGDDEQDTVDREPPSPDDLDGLLNGDEGL